MGLIRKAVTVVTNEVINQTHGYRHDDAVIERARNVQRIQQTNTRQAGTSDRPK